MTGDQRRFLPTGHIGSVGDRTAGAHGSATELLGEVHRRLGGLGVDIQTFGESDRVEIRWRRDYDGEWSDERFWSAHSIEGALMAVLDYEHQADLDGVREAKP